MKKPRHTLAYTTHSGYPVYLVVRESEIPDYKVVAEKFNATLIPVPDSVDRIASTYDYIQEAFIRNSRIRKVVFMDDDLSFAERTDFTKPNLTALDVMDIDRILDDLFGALEGSDTAMAGIAHRRGAQNHRDHFKFNQKLIAVLACDLQKMGHLKWSWEADSMFDHQMVLSVLQTGMANVMIAKWTHDDVFPRHTSGGCTSYRSIDVHSEAARALAKKFPGVVTLREKFNKDLNRYGLDVTMHMKKYFGGN